METINLSLLGNNIIVEMIDACGSDWKKVPPEFTGEKKSSSIVLPDEVKFKTQYAKVVTVGKKVKEIKVGDMVVFRPKADVRDLYFRGKHHWMMDQKDVLAVWEE